ncbi:MAG: NADH-quinone oxidoreductase subunit N [Pirellulales bacterium]
MPFNAFVDTTLQETMGHLRLFLPELVLCGTILLLLSLRVISWTRKVPPSLVAIVGVVAALWFAIPEGALRMTGDLPHGETFGGLLVFDRMAIFFRCLFLVFVTLFCILTRITRMPHAEDLPDFYTLVLGATIGFCLMASANHLLTVFVAVEMASIPSYVLAGFLKDRSKSTEAALKYSVYGAGAAGIMLYGISLLSGVLGTAHLPTMASQLVTVPFSPQTLMVLALGGLMLMVGLAFKLSGVPFHFWCPDVFEGAPAEIDAFLSVASKAAALALLVRVAVGLGYTTDTPADPPAARTAAVATQPVPVVTAGFPVREVADPHQTPGAASEVPTGTNEVRLRPESVRRYIVMLLTLLAAVTCTFGNLAAYGQTNIKRMLAYSTIAHAGYMIMPVPAALVLADLHPELARGAIAALAFYTSVYLFMNLSAFAIVAFLRDAAETEEIADYAGLIRTAPVIIVCLAAVMISLIGIPPFAGFISKFFVFASLIEAGGPIMIALVVIGGLNSVLSLIYYLRVIKVMTVDPEPDSRGPVVLGFMPTTYAVVVTLPVLIFGVFFNGLYRWAEIATSQLF